MGKFKFADILNNLNKLLLNFIYALLASLVISLIVALFVGAKWWPAGDSLVTVTHLLQLTVTIILLVLGSINAYTNSRIADDERDKIANEKGDDEATKEVLNRFGCQWITYLRIIVREIFTMGVIYFVGTLIINIIILCRQSGPNDGDCGDPGGAIGVLYSLLGTLFFNWPWGVIFWGIILLLLIILIAIGYNWVPIKGSRFKMALQPLIEAQIGVTGLVKKLLGPLLLSLISITIFTYLSERPAGWIVGKPVDWLGPTICLGIFAIACIFGIGSGIEKCIRSLQESGRKIYRAYLQEKLLQGCYGWENIHLQVSLDTTSSDTSAKADPPASSSAGGNKKNNKITTKFGRQSFKAKIVKKIK